MAILRDPSGGPPPSRREIPRWVWVAALVAVVLAAVALLR
jgi:hypothetical protein